MQSKLISFQNIPTSTQAASLQAEFWHKGMQLQEAVNFQLLDCSAMSSAISQH